MLYLVLTKYLSISNCNNYTYYLLDQGESEVAESSILVSKVPTAQKSPIYSATSTSSGKKVTIWPLGTKVHRLPVYELEKQLKKMKPSQITSICLDLAAQLRTLETQFERLKRPKSELEKINEEDEDDEIVKYSETITDQSLARNSRCRFNVSGCPYKLPSMQQHEERECKYRPTRCPSLTCPVKPPFVKVLKHILVSKR